MSEDAAHTPTPTSLTSRDRAVIKAAYLVAVAALAVGSSELALRLKGVVPWETGDLGVTVEPGGRFFETQPELGYSILPGTYDITLQDGYKFRVTHLQNRLRITHPVGGVVQTAARDEVWIFGCSFTYGWSLNDNETYPWRVQEQLPDYEVVNFGINGYGTIHSLLQFRDALREKRPKVAVLSYGGLHDIRNTFSRYRKKIIAPWNKLGPLTQPYARIVNNGNLEYAMGSVEFHEFPLMRTFALAHFVELQYDKIENWRLRSHSVSEALVKDMAMLAKEHDVQFVVAGITDDQGSQDMLRFAREQGIPTVDISVDLSDKANTNEPHDNHPGPRATRVYADKLTRFLKTEVLR